MILPFNMNCRVESVYIHWPFCPYRCHFCPFVALAGHDHYMEQYHEMLCKEIEAFGQNIRIKPELKTIFLGGGTPSTYPAPLLLDMFDRLNTVFNFTENIEISIEVNPGTVTMERLQTWKKVGINRLSIGVQSFNDAVLKSLNRHQTKKEVIKLINEASGFFKNISIDLILGLPEVSIQEWKETIKEVCTWPLQHISIYFLMVHEDTQLYFNVLKKKVILPIDEEIVELYKWTVEYLYNAGLYQYEISNFARKDFYSRHNSAYWMRYPYKGFGLGACSFDGENRFQNEKNLLKYFQKLESNESITSFYETLNAEQIWLEKLMLGLRQKSGVRIVDILINFSSEQQKAFKEQVMKLCQKELLYTTGENIALTVAGLAVENEIILSLTPTHL